MMDLPEYHNQGMVFPLNQAYFLDSGMNKQEESENDSENIPCQVCATG